MTDSRGMRLGLLMGGLMLACLGSAPVRAQTQIESREALALRDQIAQLQYQIQQLQAQVGSGGGERTYAPPPSGGGNDMTAQLLVQVNQLSDQVRQLQGRVDVLQNQLQQQTADLGKRIDDLSFQLQNPQAAAGQAGGGAAPPRAATALGSPQSYLGTPPAGSPTPPIAPPRTPELAMQQGETAMARGDYPAAETAAREVLANRTSPRAYDAQFLLAEAQYGQRQYSQAALSFDDVYNRSRRGPHAEDALLGLANSLTALGDRTAACQAIGKLRGEFPTPRPELRQPITAAAQRAGCR
jgi:TolA-binding protein